MTHSTPRQAIALLTAGIKLANQPGIRRYVWIPLLINIILFSFGFYYLYQWIGHWMDALVAWLPGWLSWLATILWPVLLISVLLLGGFCFSSVANLIAAPFNSMLSLKVEKMLSPEMSPIEEPGFMTMIGSSLKREWAKIRYSVPRLLICSILFLIPGIGHLIAPWIWLVFSAWMTAIEYCDYPYDNHGITFQVMRQELGEKRRTSFTLGLILSLLTSVPFVNLVLMPIGVCAATLHWVERRTGGRIQLP